MGSTMAYRGVRGSGGVMNARKQLVVLFMASVLAAGLASGTATSSAAVRANGMVAIVQAVPDMRMVIGVDGEQVRDGVAVGTVIGPLPLTAGEHEVEFSFDGGSVAATVEVDAGRSNDVVVHLPADVGGEPVVSVFPSPSDPIGRGRARVLLAHTATVAPADVQVDGQIVFTNIANGEYAQADVAAGAHRVSLLPSGVDAAPILGPLDVDLKAGTLTSVYAVGNPTTRSMRVIVRVTSLVSDGSSPPTGADTGAAGLVAGVDVHGFGPGG
jgi:hypothetical protein